MLEVLSIVDNVRKHLLSQILHGELHPGQQVKEQEIATSLGISRPPIREALKLLEADGLIIRKPNRGAFVATITEHDAWEIYTLKCNLYEMATRLAFEHISSEAIREWDRIVDEMGRCLLSETPAVIQYQSLNQEFHDVMFRIAGHRRLQKISQTLHHQMNRFSCISLMDADHLKGSITYHRNILGAIRNGDLERTIAITREHILKGLEIVQAIIARERSSQEYGEDERGTIDRIERPKGYRDGIERKAA